LSLEGIIIRKISGFYDVLCNHEEIQCKARGIFRKDKNSPMVGDHVVIDEDEKVIISIEQRKNHIRRPAVSNVDHLGIIIAIKDPLPDHMLIDKLIISALINDIKPSLIINKVDLAAESALSSVENEYSNSGCGIFRISCKQMVGLDEVKKTFQHGIVALAGQSGVGKSSLLNLLCVDTRLGVGELSLRTATGKHTTTHAQIIPLPSGAMMIDTPGFSSIEIADIMPHELQRYYSEFIQLRGLCRFIDCHHDFEPNCAVKNAVSDSLVSLKRYERYISILRSIRDEKGRYVK